VTGDELLVF